MDRVLRPQTQLARTLGAFIRAVGSAGRRCWWCRRRSPPRAPRRLTGLGSLWRADIGSQAAIRRGSAVTAAATVAFGVAAEPLIRGAERASMLSG